MKFDFIYMNPPYSIGGKITECSLDGRCVCLMPLSQYKSGLYKYVESFELADPKMFSDASITNNLCICVLRSKEVNRYGSYRDMEMCSFDRHFIEFFKHNSGNFVTPIDKCTKRFKTIEDGRKFFPADSENLVFFGVRMLSGGISKGSFDYKYNMNICGNEELPFDRNEENYCMGGRLFRCSGKANLVKWLYGGKLASCIVGAKNADTRKCDDVLPQIDWELISDHPLWIQGDYDGAVLDVMGLKWNDDKSGIVEN